MPFKPLTPEEEKMPVPTRNHPEHNPPTHIVITYPMKWVCPGCGREVVIKPVIVNW
jgi:hypothetical protein